MKFKTHKQGYYQVSEEGYHISKQSVDGQFVYTAWAPKELEPLGYVSNLKQAQKLCLDHKKTEQKNGKIA